MKTPLTKEQADDCIKVYPPELCLVDLKTMRPATVSWRSIGAVSQDDAELFAYRLLDAAKRAKEMNEKE